MRQFLPLPFEFDLVIISIILYFGKSCNIFLKIYRKFAADIFEAFSRIVLLSANYITSVFQTVHFYEFAECIKIIA